MKKNRKLALALTGIMMIGLVTGCGKKKEEPTTTATETVINVGNEATMTDVPEMPERTKDGYVINPYTGEWIEESFKNKRPLCIMINNIIDAMPQSGISQADLTYEMLVEGGITRYLCVFQDYSKLEKLGPVRSARPYYVKMANMLDGYYAHVGWNSFAEEQIDLLGVNNLNGLTALSDIMYYRDNSRYAPHNVYTDAEKIQAGVDYEGYRTEHDSRFHKMFDFNYDDTPIGSGKKANKVTTAFGYYAPWFEYNETDKMYYRFQYDEEQIDDQTNEQLKYKNVIVMFVQYVDIHEGLLDIDYTLGGKGYYISDGEYMEMEWKNKDGSVIFCGPDGKQIKMNPGQSFITVFPQEKASGVTFE